MDFFSRERPGCLAALFHRPHCGVRPTRSKILVHPSFVRSLIPRLDEGVVHHERHVEVGPLVGDVLLWDRTCIPVELDSSSQQAPAAQDAVLEIYIGMTHYTSRLDEPSCSRSTTPRYWHTEMQHGAPISPGQLPVEIWTAASAFRPEGWMRFLSHRRFPPRRLVGPWRGPWPI